jgi:microcystin-dependent protein
MAENHNLKYSGSEINELLDDAHSLTGIIVMWSGAINTIPSGWNLCDGTNGTPDLRDRFIVGVGSSYTVGTTGGSNDVTLTTAQMPAHTHTGSTNSTGGHTHTVKAPSMDKYYSDMGGYAIQAYGSDTYTTEKAGDHSHTLTINSTGGGAAHENRPPYYALAYIMKV